MTPATTDVNANMRRHAEQRRAQRAAMQPAVPATAAPQPGVGPERPAVAANGKGDRWATYNAFVDVVAPRLTLAERAVWHVMFRHTRNGVCETSVRMLAAAGGIGRATADRALRRLCAFGLVRAIWKSCDKSKASKYAINPRPDRCVGSLPSFNEPSSP